MDFAKNAVADSRGFCLASPPDIFFISKLIIIDWSITLCDVTPKSRIRIFKKGTCFSLSDAQ
jgi:hypothetical protein